MADFQNTLYYADNLVILKELSKQYPQGFIDLIYIDPPFNSKRNYNILFEDLILNKENGEKNKALKEAFSDTWSNVNLSQELEEMKGYTDKPQLYRFLTNNREIFTSSQMSYLTMMAHRIYYMHKVLKDTGSFYLHCDPTMSHYLKILLDIIFGEKNFRNEITWNYNTQGKPKKFFAKKHDIIFLYTKGENTLFNKISIEPSDIDRYNKIDENGEKYQIDGKGYIYYLKDGRYCPDYWDIPALTNHSKERLGYPTQKPEALLERIIKASSNEGDIVADFFCGCGTAVTVAQKLGRKWLGVDINHLAISLVEEKRLKPLKSEYKVIGFPQDIAGAEKLAKDDKHLFEQWVVEYLFRGHQTKKTGDGGIDGHIAYTLPDQKKLLSIIEVKGGNVTIGQIRAFKDSITKFNSDFGIFVCFEKYITKGMREEADNLGIVDTETLQKLQKMYIITIEDIMNNRMPDTLRAMSHNITY